MPVPVKLRILIAPLDWGLGHTTRCVPVIRALQQRGATVVLAGNKLQEKVLLEEFPGCEFLPLQGYEVGYSHTSKGFLLKMMQQLPRITSVIQKENRWLQTLLARQKIDGVISDNRFGLYSRQVPCVFVTHQLGIKTGLGRMSDWLVRLLNYRYINRFSRLWIPDFEGLQNLAGALSHPRSLPSATISYLGPLTRIDGAPAVAGDRDQGVLFVISGPEPQRSIFEKKIFEQVRYIHQPVTIIRGLPLQEETPSVGNAVVYNHLPARDMEAIMRAATFIVCRSGYSSVMDINALGQKAILIPTPGQPEQEYLAAWLAEAGFAPGGKQDSFNLEELFASAERFSYSGFIPVNHALLHQAIDAFLSDCARR